MLELKLPPTFRREKVFWVRSVKKSLLKEENLLKFILLDHNKLSYLLKFILLDYNKLSF